MKINFTGKIGKNFVKISFSDKIAESRFVAEKGKKALEIKISEKEKNNWRQATLIARKIIFFARKYGLKNIALDWDEINAFKFGTAEETAETFGVNFEMANYEFIKYRQAPKEGWNFVENLQILNGEKLINYFKKGKLIGEEINNCRELANIPGGGMTPAVLANSLRSAVRGTKIKLKVLEEKEMQKLGMGAILGVGKGSREKSKFIILEYTGKEEKNPIVLIGKGVTYDTGGLDLKPGNHMADMFMDMSGGAAVAYAIIAAVKLGVRKKIIGLIPAVENMPSGESLRPGDILRSMSGQTIEIQSTDAEGRVIMADANTYAEKYQPRLVVNVATLTGAATVALGERASAILTKDEKLQDLFLDLGERSGDYVWPLPLWDEYEAEIKGANGDICNIRNQADTRAGGTILGAMFIYQFAKNFSKWIHIDMASRMTPVFDEFLSKGAAGSPVRLLVKLLEKC